MASRGYPARHELAISRRQPPPAHREGRAIDSSPLAGSAGRDALTAAMEGCDLQGHFGWPPPLAQARRRQPDLGQWDTVSSSKFRSPFRNR